MHYLGKMNQKCDYCKSINFQNESFQCCHNGKIKLDPLHKYPLILRNLLTGTSSQAIISKITLDNTIVHLPFASMDATLANPPGRDPPCFRVCGQIFHRSGNFHPTNDQVPMFNQLYIIDTDAANNYCVNQPAKKPC